MSWSSISRRSRRSSSIATKSPASTVEVEVSASSTTRLTARGSFGSTNDDATSRPKVMWPSRVEGFGARASIASTRAGRASFWSARPRVGFGRRGLVPFKTHESPAHPGPTNRAARRPRCRADGRPTSARERRGVRGWTTRLVDPNFSQKTLVAKIYPRYASPRRGSLAHLHPVPSVRVRVSHTEHERNRRPARHRPDLRAREFPSPRRLRQRVRRRGVQKRPAAEQQTQRHGKRVR